MPLDCLGAVQIFDVCCDCSGAFYIVSWCLHADACFYGVISRPLLALHVILEVIHEGNLETHQSFLSGRRPDIRTFPTLFPFLQP